MTSGSLPGSILESGSGLRPGSPGVGPGASLTLSEPRGPHLFASGLPELLRGEGQFAVYLARLWSCGETGTLPSQGRPRSRLLPLRRGADAARSSGVRSCLSEGLRQPPLGAGSPAPAAGTGASRPCPGFWAWAKGAGHLNAEAVAIYSIAVPPCPRGEAAKGRVIRIVTTGSQVQGRRRDVGRH